MATTRKITELRRWRDVAAIRENLNRLLPEGSYQVGLAHISQLCRRHAAAHPVCDWNERRHRLLGIAVEWDLSRDRLELQSDACLREITIFLQA
jgi:hypothetical protein